jgi:hypothetical protein
MPPPIQPFCVSITGADNNVRIEDLIALGQAYSFVEWGMIRSILGACLAPFATNE